MIVTLLARPSRSNCLLWALRQFITQGGWLLLTRSEYGWWPHAAWSPDLRAVYAYMPFERKHRRRWWQVPFSFAGEPRLTRGAL